eukprot:TRINITY_DN15781_c0_g1_i1.p1 TRINITY_DN15781_c0_g1~~TRINITY_DN15781_c0_g1_i1.p1  ORF type:complete len:275 (+),score=66.19 TRINITY_DN15781_c0_g1_i1:203-1027(+)
MGLDGGSIPSRTDLLRRSSWRLANAHQTNRSTRGGSLDNCGAIQEGPTAGQKLMMEIVRWSVCALSGQPLRQGYIVADDLGKIYNQESVLEFALGSGQFQGNKEELLQNGFKHLTPKRTFKLVLKSNPAVEKDKEYGSNEATADTPAPWVCPITGHETNGRHAFIALKPCGHVFSEKALIHVGEHNCVECGTPYTREDIVSINPSEDKAVEMREKMNKKIEEEEKLQKEKKEKKKSKKRGSTSGSKEKKKAKKSEETPSETPIPSDGKQEVIVQ